MKRASVWTALDQVDALKVPRMPLTTEEEEVIDENELDELLAGIQHDSAPAEGNAELVDDLHSEFVSDFTQNPDQFDESVVSTVPPELSGSSSKKPSTSGGNMERYSERQRALLHAFFDKIKGTDEKLPPL